MTGPPGMVHPPTVLAASGAGLPDELRALYRERRNEIETRLREFRAIWEAGSDEDLFAEMTFCLCAIQTSARVSDRTTRNLRDRGLLRAGSRRHIRDVLRGGYVRFHENKSRWIVEARRRFMEPNPTIRQDLEKRAHSPPALRDWLEEEIRGLGPKEASHFLRNIGLGENLAILDRHILTNLRELGVLDALPPNLTRTRYLEIEERLQAFCERANVPLGHMDLLLWAKETGFVFK
ncbi:MAG: N-glycosylase/DNA lyase [Thermoplasmata archaeon]